MTDFKPIQIPAGVVTNATKTMRSSNWSEVNLMRWVEGELQPVGGQVRYTYHTPDAPAFASRCKMIHGWYDLSGVSHIAYVCEQHVYVDTAGVLADITPAAGWPVPPLPGQGGYGDLNYGQDYPVPPATPTTGYGDPRPSGAINPVTKKPNIWSVDNFGAILLVMYSVDGKLLQWDPAAGAAGVIVTLASTAAWTTSTPNIIMTANPGSVTPGMSVYNTTTHTSVGFVSSYTGTALVLTANALNAGASGNQLAFGNVLTPVANAPQGRCFVVTQERFVMVFGATVGTPLNGSDRRFAWCDQENLTAWDYTNVVSQAGYLDIEPASPILSACSGKFGTLFFTAAKAYVSRYIGLPFVYNYVELADETTPWSPASIVSTSGLMLWMSKQGMYSFDGTSISPIACLVRPWINDDHDEVNVREQACAVHLGDFSEFWWFFPQKGQPYNTRCVIYNYKEGWWSQGRMARSAGITSTYTSLSIMADGREAYQHEYGTFYSAGVELPWAETFDLNLTSGRRLVTVKQMLPDVRGDMLNVNFSFYTRMSRALPGADFGIWSPPAVLRPDGYVDLRVTGRGVRMKIATVGPDIKPFTCGQHLLDFAERGDR